MEHTVRLFIALILALFLAGPVHAQFSQSGYVMAPVGTTCPTAILSPVPLQTVCWDPTAKDLAYWSGSAWVVISGGGGGGGTLTGAGAATLLPVWLGPTTLGAIPGAKVASNFGINAVTTGGAFSIKTGLSFVDTTINTATPQFLWNLGLNATQGSADTVGQYIGVVKTGGTGDVWAMNPLLQINAGSGSYNAQAIELDFNNLNAHRGDADGAAGLVPPVAYNLSISGASNFRKTGAIVVDEASGIFNRGIVFALNSISATGSTYQDVNNGHDKSIDIRGKPNWGIYQSATINGSSGTAINNWLNAGVILGPVALASLPPAGQKGRLLVVSDDSTLRLDTGASWIALNATTASGIVQLNGQSGATQNFANDTNVTITSAANVHTLGWQSTLSVPRGGTGNATATLNGVLFGNGTNALQATASAVADNSVLVAATAGASPVFTNNPTVATLSTASNPGIRIQPFGAAAGNTGELRLLELVANGTNYAGFKASDSLAGNLMWVLPPTDAAGCWQSNGSGVLSISACPGSGGTPGGVSGNVQFNSTGSFGGDNALFWDNTNKRLGIGTNGPVTTLQLNGDLTALSLSTDESSLHGFRLKVTESLTSRISGQSFFPYAEMILNGVNQAQKVGWLIESVNGVTPQTLGAGGLTASGTTATVTTPSPHNLVSNEYVVVSGANQATYNGLQLVTVTGANTFTYTMSGSPASPATGTIIVEQFQNNPALYVAHFSNKANPANPGFNVGLAVDEWGNGTAAQFSRLVTSIPGGIPALADAVSREYGFALQLFNEGNTTGLNAFNDTNGLVMGVGVGTTGGSAEGIRVFPHTNASSLSSRVALRVTQSADNHLTTAADSFVLNLDGSMVAGAAPGGNKGPGTLNATGLYVNGTPVGGGGPPGGSNTQVQFNNAGSFGGSPVTTTTTGGFTLTPVAITHQSLTDLVGDRTVATGFSTANFPAVRWETTSGTGGAPLTSTGSTIRVSRTEQVAGNTCGTNAIDDSCHAGISVVSLGTAATRMQTVGIYTEATGSGVLGSPGTLSNTVDVVGLTAFGNHTGDGQAAGAFIVGHYGGSGTGNSLGIEVHAENFSSGKSCSYNTGGVSNCTGVMAVANTTGGQTNGAGYIVVNGGGNGWNVGHACTAGSTTDSCFRDDSSAATAFSVLGTHTTGVNFNGGTYSNAALFLGSNSGSTGDSILKWGTGSFMNLAGTVLASLGAPTNGTMLYCSDCLLGSNPCTNVAGTGAIAKRLNGAWVCS
jgi:hypothetical protein